MVDKKNRVRIVDDEREAANIAHLGDDPEPFSGKGECEACLNGKRVGLHAPPLDSSHINMRHLSDHHEHNLWLNTPRMSHGRMTVNDHLGFQVPHPQNHAHLTEDGSSRTGGFFNTQGHLGYKKNYPTPNIDLETAKRLIKYLEVDAPEDGAFTDGELNKILGLGHAETGLDSVRNLATGEWTHKPVPFGDLQRGAAFHWQNIGMTKDAAGNSIPDPNHPSPAIGQWLDWAVNRGPVRLHNLAQERLHKFSQHDHLQSVAGGVRDGKTPCFFCAGHGTVEGFRVLDYLSSFPDWDSVSNEEVQAGAGDTWEGSRMTGRVNRQHPDYEQHHNEINQYLSAHSAPFGGQWSTNDPFSELQAQKTRTYLCPECTGLGICTPCGGEGEIPIADASMSDEDAEQFHNSWPRWKQATNIAFDSPAQPWMRPWETGSGEPMPSFFQTEPGEGQFGVGVTASPRPFYTEALNPASEFYRPYTAPPFEPSPNVGVVSPVEWTDEQLGQQEEQRQRRLKEQRQGRVLARRKAKAHEQQMAEMGTRAEERKREHALVMARRQMTSRPQMTAPPPKPQEAQFDEETGKMIGITGSAGQTVSVAGDDEELSEDEMYSAHAPDDHRKFTLTGNKTPFEIHGNQAWNDWSDRKFIPNEFHFPKETNSYGSGMGFRIDEQGRGFIDDTAPNKKWQEAHAANKKNWESRREAGGGTAMIAPDEKTEEDTRDKINKDKQKDLNASHRKMMQQLTSRIYRAPNSVWRDRSFRDLQAALQHSPIKGTRAIGAKLDNSHLMRDFEKRGGGEGKYVGADKDKKWKHAKGDIKNSDHVMNSGLAEMALFRMIRTVHPDWLPNSHDDLVMQHQDYMDMATAKQKEADSLFDGLNDIQTSNDSLLRNALAVLKFYDAQHSAQERVGVVGTAASVSSLNHTASAHPNRIAVRR